jgi:hypothetical protein
MPESTSLAENCMFCSATYSSMSERRRRGHIEPCTSGKCNSTLLLLRHLLLLLPKSLPRLNLLPLTLRLGIQFLPRRQPTLPELRRKALYRNRCRSRWRHWRGLPSLQQKCKRGVAENEVTSCEQLNKVTKNKTKAASSCKQNEPTHGNDQNSNLKSYNI